MKRMRMKMDLIKKLKKQWLKYIILLPNKGILYKKRIDPRLNSKNLYNLQGDTTHGNSVDMRQKYSEEQIRVHIERDLRENLEYGKNIKQNEHNEIENEVEKESKTEPVKDIAKSKRPFENITGIRYKKKTDKMVEIETKKLEQNRKDKIGNVNIIERKDIYNKKTQEKNHASSKKFDCKQQKEFNQINKTQPECNKIPVITQNLDVNKYKINTIKSNPIQKENYRFLRTVPQDSTDARETRIDSNHLVSLQTKTKLDDVSLSKNTNSGSESCLNIIKNYKELCGRDETCAKLPVKNIEDSIQSEKNLEKELPCSSKNVSNIITNYKDICGRDESCVKVPEKDIKHSVQSKVDLEKELSCSSKNISKVNSMPMQTPDNLNSVEMSENISEDISEVAKYNTVMNSRNIFTRNLVESRPLQLPQNLKSVKKSKKKVQFNENLQIKDVHNETNHKEKPKLVANNECLGEEIALPNIKIQKMAGRDTESVTITNNISNLSSSDECIIEKDKSNIYNTNKLVSVDDETLLELDNKSSKTPKSTEECFEEQINIQKKALEILQSVTDSEIALENVRTNSDTKYSTEDATKPLKKSYRRTNIIELDHLTNFCPNCMADLIPDSNTRVDLSTGSIILKCRVCYQEIIMKGVMSPVTISKKRNVNMLESTKQSADSPANIHIRKRGRPRKHGSKNLTKKMPEKSKRTIDEDSVLCNETPNQSENISNFISKEKIQVSKAEFRPSKPKRKLTVKTVNDETVKQIVEMIIPEKQPRGKLNIVSTKTVYDEIIKHVQELTEPEMQMRATSKSLTAESIKITNESDKNPTEEDFDCVPKILDFKEKNVDAKEVEKSDAKDKCKEEMKREFIMIKNKGYADNKFIHKTKKSKVSKKSQDFEMNKCSNESNEQCAEPESPPSQIIEKKTYNKYVNELCAEPENQPSQIIEKKTYIKYVSSLDNSKKDTIDPLIKNENLYKEKSFKTVTTELSSEKLKVAVPYKKPSSSTESHNYILCSMCKTGFIGKIVYLEHLKKGDCRSKKTESIKAKVTICKICKHGFIGISQYEEHLKTHA